MRRRTTPLDVKLLTEARLELARSLRRFDLYPNRGIDLPYQPSTPRNVDASFDPVPCTHGVDWLRCEKCSTRKT